MNHYSKYLGLDDGYFPPEFKGRRGRTVLVGSVTEGTKPLDLFVEFIEVDGVDGTDQAISICSEALKTYDLRAIITDGVTYAGFNIIDPRRLYSEVNIPVITIFRHDLDMGKVKRALEKHFSDWSFRYEVISSTYSESRKVMTRRGILRLFCLGIDFGDCVDLVSRLQTAFPEPQPLKIADLTASALSRFLLATLQSEITDDDNHRQ